MFSRRRPKQSQRNKNSPIPSTSTESVSIKDDSVPLLDKKRPKLLLDVAYRSWKSDLYTDVTIVVGTERFKAHRLILASLSDYFPPLFKVDEKDSGEVTLHKIEPEDFSVLLHFAYTGVLKITKENVQNILIAADYLSIGEVKALCMEFMVSQLDCDNVCDVLMFTRAYSLLDLEQKALDFLKSNLDNVSTSASFSQLDPKFLIDIFEDDNLIIYQNNVVLRSQDRELAILNSIMRYLAQKPKQDPDVVDMMIRCVRMPLLRKEMIKQCLKNFKNLEKSVIIQKYVRLRDIATRYRNGVQNRKETEDIPDTWLRLRKLASFKITNGQSCYAAEGEIVFTPDPPSSLHNDVNLEIRRIDIFMRRWDGRLVVGGLKVSYRSSIPDDGPREDYVRGRIETQREHRFLELEPNEYIVKVVIGAGWLIDRLGFVTNTGRTWGPFGGPGGSEYTECAPEGVLSYLWDINCDTVRTQGEDAIHNLNLRWVSFE